MVVVAAAAGERATVEDESLGAWSQEVVEGAATAGAAVAAHFQAEDSPVPWMPPRPELPPRRAVSGGRQLPQAPWPAASPSGATGR